MLDLDDLAHKAETLMLPSREWEKTFTAPVVKELIRMAKESAEHEASEPPQPSPPKCGKCYRDMIVWSNGDSVWFCPSCVPIPP